LGVGLARSPVFWKANGLISGFVTLYLYTSHGSPERVVVMLSSAMLIIVPADMLRLNYPPFERTYEKALGFLMRESEKVRQYHAPFSPPLLSYIKRRLTSSFPSGFAETLQWRDMVHHWRGLCALVIPSRYRCIVYHDVSFHPFRRPLDSYSMLPSLSWADTAASTFGRLWGSRTPPLPPRIPILGLPLAPRKSLAGFLAASITGAAIVFSFWSWFVPAVGGVNPSWDLMNGVSGPGVDRSSLGQGMKALLRDASFSGLSTGGWMGLAVISVVSGLVTGIAEALGTFFSLISPSYYLQANGQISANLTII
jgi:diacylglycerol kinase (CTP)